MTQKTRSTFKTDLATAIPDGAKRNAADYRAQYEHLADSAMFPADFSTGTVTPFPGAIDLSGNTEGAVWTVRDGAVVLEVPAWEQGTVEIVTDSSPQLGGNLDLNGYSIGAADASDLTKLSEITVAAAAVNFLNGVTSDVQAQLNAKAGTNHTHTLVQISDAGTAAAYDVGDFASDTHTHTLADISDWPDIDATEVSYLDGVTSSIQTQIDARVASDTTVAGGGTVIGNIVEITQAAYDALGAPDDETLYIING